MIAKSVTLIYFFFLASGLIFHANKDSEYQYKMRADLLKQQISNLLRRINSLNEYKNGFKLSKDKKDYVVCSPVTLEV